MEQWSSWAASSSAVASRNLRSIVTYALTAARRLEMAEITERVWMKSSASVSERERPCRNQTWMRWPKVRTWIPSSQASSAAKSQTLLRSQRQTPVSPIRWAAKRSAVCVASIATMTLSNSSSATADSPPGGHTFQHPKIDIAIHPNPKFPAHTNDSKANSRAYAETLVCIERVIYSNRSRQRKPKCFRNPINVSQMNHIRISLSSSSPSPLPTMAPINTVFINT
mmetsp:Transcript_40600/g.108902  ORF Transcript_40600/g.108902 Transcript_40600/m.108902 type:complete len:225 (-) Transcript_40600:467-1141(-)